MIALKWGRGVGPDVVTGKPPFVQPEAKQHRGFKTGEQVVVFTCWLVPTANMDSSRLGSRHP